MPQTPSLRLYEELALLALRDDKGTVSISFIEQALAGAMAAELVALGRISLTEDKKKLVDLLDASPTGDELLDQCIALIAKAKRRARLTTWVSRFASIKRLAHKAAEQLCHRGILEPVKSKVLFIFNRTVYPERNPQPEAAIVERLEIAIFRDDTELSWNDSLLISLANSCNLLPQIFDRKRLKTRKKRIKQITEGELIGKATQDVIAACQAALIVTTVVVPVAVASGS